MTNSLIEATAKSPFELKTFADYQAYANMICNSDFCPKAYKGKPGDIMICLQSGYELGFTPLQSLQWIAVINGKRTVYGDGLVALVRKQKSCKSIKEWMEGSIKAGNAVAHCEVVRGDETIKRSFSISQAVQAGLTSKGDVWGKYPERMLQMRARGFALRDSYADVLGGLIDEDFEDDIVSTPRGQNNNNLGVDAVQSILNSRQETVIEQEPLATVEEIERLVILTKEHNVSDETMNKWLEKAGVESFYAMPQEKIQKIIAHLEIRQGEKINE